MTAAGRKHEPVRTTVAKHMFVADTAGQDVLAVATMQFVVRAADDCELVIARSTVEETRPQ